MKQIILEIPNEISVLNIVVCAMEKDGSITFGGHSSSTDIEKITLSHPAIGSLEWKEWGKK